MNHSRFTTASPYIYSIHREHILRCLWRQRDVDRSEHNSPVGVVVLVFYSYTLFPHWTLWVRLSVILARLTVVPSLIFFQKRDLREEGAIAWAANLEGVFLLARKMGFDWLAGFLELCWYGHTVDRLQYIRFPYPNFLCIWRFPVRRPLEVDFEPSETFI